MSNSTTIANSRIFVQTEFYEKHSQLREINI